MVVLHYLREEKSICAQVDLVGGSIVTRGSEGREEFTGIQNTSPLCKKWEGHSEFVASLCTQYVWHHLLSMSHWILQDLT